MWCSLAPAPDTALAAAWTAQDGPTAGAPAHPHCPSPRDGDSTTTGAELREARAAPHRNRTRVHTEPPRTVREGTEGHPCAGMQRPAHPRCSSAFVSAGGQEPAPWHRLLQTQPQQPLLQPAEQGPWRDEITAMNSSGGGREPARPEPRWAGASSGSRAGAALAQDPLCLRPSLEQRGEPLSPERGQQLLTPPVKERAGCGLCSPQQYVICHDSNR